jgi:hypothetical protein
MNQYKKKEIMFGKDVHKDVTAKYFKDKRMMKIIMNNKPGPDFFSDGEAIYVSEPGININQILNKVIDFAFTYTRTYVVIPIQSVDLNSLIKLYLVWDMLKEMYQRSVRICFILKNNEKEYSIQTFYGPTEMFNILIEYTRKVFNKRMMKNTNKKLGLLEHIDILPNLGLEEQIKEMGTKIKI